jgi:hypothetical protein
MGNTYNMATNNAINNKRGTNIQCDRETHEALDILGAWMIGKEHMHKDLKDSINVPKPKVIKILALEKINQLGLVKNSSSEVASIK